MRLNRLYYYGIGLALAAFMWAGCSDDGAGKPGSCQELDCASQQRVCTSEGGSPRCGVCEDGFAEEDGSCREARFCVDLNCAAEQRTCAEATGGQDAACTTCRAGFVEDSTGACVPDANATCDPDSSDSIAETCAEQHRECVEGDAQSPASCSGPCLSGYRLDEASDACVPVKTCADIQSSCDGVCVPHPNQDAECVANHCADDQAFIPGVPAEEACVACNFEGLTGCGEGHFARASGADECVCVTEKGYFWNPNRFPVAGPELCDKDNDGWVDKRAADFLTDPNADPVLKQAANCNFQIVDRFVLTNDIAEDENREVSVAELTGGAMATVVLQESVRNDDPQQLGAAYNAGELPLTNGRQLPAAALNSLTKLCADTRADFNDNGQRDLTEFQPAGLAGNAAEIFARLSHFLMLADGRFVPGAEPEIPGRYIITERTRGQDLALKYAADAGDYWQSCGRFPDAIYTDANISKKIGTDFARFSTPPADHLITNANAWRGMNHNSQFKCLNVVATEPTEQADKGPHVVLLADVQAEDGGGYAINDCRFSGEVEAAEDTNPSTVKFSCDPLAPGDIDPGVIWGAVEYISGPYSDPRGENTPSSGAYTYTRGCADMCAVWRAPACAGFSDDPLNDSAKCYADAADYGKRYCGCGLTYGGLSCDYGCPDIDMVMTSPDYNPGNRAGKYWVCGQVSGSYMETPFTEPDAPAQSGYQVRGILNPGATHGDTVLQNSCDAPGCRAYRVR